MQAQHYTFNPRVGEKRPRLEEDNLKQRYSTLRRSREGIREAKSLVDRYVGGLAMPHTAQTIKRLNEPGFPSIATHGMWNDLETPTAESSVVQYDSSWRQTRVMNAIPRINEPTQEMEVPKLLAAGSKLEYSAEQLRFGNAPTELEIPALPNNSQVQHRIH